MKIPIYVLILFCLFPVLLIGIPFNKLPKQKISFRDGLSILDLSNKKLTDVKGLSSLMVSYKGNQVALSEVPQLRIELIGNQVSLDQLLSEIIDFDNLVELDVSKNYIEHVTDNMRFPINLKRLDLSHNRLNDSPNFENLSNLRYLNLSTNLLIANKLSQLPDEICKLTHLRKFDVSGNRLTSLPYDIGNLCNLDDLNVSSNKLMELPITIGNIVNITTLRINYNQLKGLPLEMSNLTKLEFLNMGNNADLDEGPALELLSRLPRLLILEGSLVFEKDIEQMRALRPTAFLRLQGISFHNQVVFHPYFARPMHDWIPEMAPIVHKEINGVMYNYLDISYKKLKSLDGIHTLQVYDLTETDESKRVKSITEIQDLYINVQKMGLLLCLKKYLYYLFWESIYLIITICLI